MNRKQLNLCGAAFLSVALLALTCAGEDAPDKSRGITIIPPSKPQADGNAKENGKTTADQSATENADEEAILATAALFVKAYNNGDAKALANQFTANAEYVDEQGYVFQGRAAIEEALSACFAAHKGAQIELTIDSIRIVNPGLAIEDGTTTLITKEINATPIVTNYTATHVKTNGQWQTASVRESAPKGRRLHRSQLEQLSWMLGEWVDEGEDTLITSTCKPVQNGNFLLREFKIHIGGSETISGEQRIGWDPLSSKLKSWTFDSDGGYSEGYWFRDDNRWYLRSVGVSTDGQPASSTTIFTPINENTMTWQTVNHEAAGMTYPDGPVITVVRRAPAPKTSNDKLSQLPSAR